MRLLRRGGLGLLAGNLAACAPALPAAEKPGAPPLAGAEATRSRRAPGVVLDRAPSLPPPTSSASPDRGLVVLLEPADVRPARRVVDAFFEAVVAESADALESLLERSAHTRSSPKARAEAALPSWRRRFERLDYTALSSDVLYRAAEVRVHTATDAAAPAAARALPVVPRGEEILVQVPLVTASTGRLFGREISFLLKPGAGGYKIGEMFEDFRLP